MERTRNHFTHDFLLEVVRQALNQSFKVETRTPQEQFSVRDCLMSALAVLTFKCPS